MLNVMLVGAAGRMGRAVAECARNMPGDVTVSAGIDVQPPNGAEFPVFSALREADRPADVVVDFSRPGSLNDILEYCKQHNIGAVLATTGYDESQLKQIDEASKSIPIFRASNFSIGIALLCQLVRQAAQVLDRSDIEIVERHHNRKVDAPSGTALSILEVLSTVRPDTKERFGRHGNNAARMPNEIGIHAVRGGGLVGDHEVMFLSENEELDITHRAYSREVFAQGALTAAGFIASKSSGIYGMQDLLCTLGLHGGQDCR